MHLLRSHAPAWTLAGATLLSGLLGAAAVVTAGDHTVGLGAASLAGPGRAGANAAPAHFGTERPAEGFASDRRPNAGVSADSHTLIRPRSTRSVTTTPPVAVVPEDLAVAQAAARTACRLTIATDRSPYPGGSACPNS